MTIKDCRDVDVNVGDFVIYVVQGNRNAGINFGYILDIKDKRQVRTRNGKDYTTGDVAVKIQHADSDGKRNNVEAIDVPGHWREDTPQSVLDYYNQRYGAARDAIMSWEDYREAHNEYWVGNTYSDTGKPSTTTIKCHGGTEHRLLVTEPIV